jgi:cation diffusion facilitator family transporter
MERTQRVSEKNGDPPKIASYSTLLNILVAITKAILAWRSGSSALLADTIHEFSNALASLLVLVGIGLSKRRSEAFPWGLYKVENFVAIVSAGFIFFAGYEIAQYVFRGGTALSLAYFYPSIFGLFAILLMITVFSRYEAKRAKVVHSPSVMADAPHWTSDIASTALVLLALLGSSVGYPILDRLAALVMVGFIAKVGGDILKDSMRILLDASVDSETLNRIRGEILRFPQAKKIKPLQARNSGRFVFVRAELVFSIKKFSRAHQLSEEIEKAILKAIPWVDKVPLHYEPLEKIFQFTRSP